MNKKRILIIDDEQDLCNLMSLNLESKGEYEVTVAYSGEEGVAKAKETEFDVVITDFSMPGINGEQVVNEMKKINPNLPVILFSIYHDDDSTLTAEIKTKADGLIHKPIDHQQLQQVIRDVLDKNKKD